MSEATAGLRHTVAKKIAAFLSEIGLAVCAGPVGDATQLPGIDIEHGVIVVDEDRLAYPGDLLHEAGHLAVALPGRRADFHHDVGNDPADEMMAIAWSWAAATHLAIDPALVFHPHGYRGGSKAILSAFSEKNYFGVPLLDCYGMTLDPDRARRQKIDGPVFPHMRRWLREA